jgi:large subunit ribosomal protein L15
MEKILSNLKNNIGAKHKKKRVGRGPGSGWGKTSGRGHKGQNSRSGGGVPASFEGGQMPLIRRLPKRGFKNPFSKKYNIINLETIEKKYSEGETVSVESLLEKKIIKKALDGVKILSNGEITKKLKFNVDKISEKAKEKIISAGGEIANNEEA